MREIGKTEIFRYKCPICGSLNKRFIPIMYKHIPYGYMLHCCNCGHIEEFITPTKHIGGLYNGQFSAGEESEQRCYQLNDCPHKDCPLYGSYVPDKDSGYDDELKGDTDTTTGGTKTDKFDCSTCPGDRCAVCTNVMHLGVYGNNSSNKKELEVKVKTRGPKFV